jgi:SET domain-containing protein
MNRAVRCAASLIDICKVLRCCGCPSSLYQMRYECELERCPCGSRCANRQLQSGSAVTTAVIDCGRKGVGVIALEAVDTERFVGEYVGEVLTSKEAKLRSQVSAQICIVAGHGALTAPSCSSTKARPTSTCFR